VYKGFDRFNCMGIYTKYGLEYRMVLKDGSQEVVVHMEALDSRLLASKYYQRRKSYYDQNGSKCSWCERALGVDIELSEEELEKLYQRLSRDDVVEHDWFDVCYLETTYYT
jgi:hypothetical protein